MLAPILAQGSQEGLMPHGMCYLWEQDLVWLHVVSDSFTTLAYWAIPPFLVYLAVKARGQIPASAPYARRRLPYDWMFFAFGLFIVACGATHAMGIWTIWEPRYWLEGGVKAVTALASVATAIALPPLVPRALELIREARESELRRVELEEAQEEQQELVQRLREADEARSRFFANISHDLRTPLSLILGPVEEALDRDDLPEPVRRRLETVRRNAGTLSGQVEDLLSVAQMEAGTLEADPRPVDVAALLRAVAEHFSAHAMGRSVDYRVGVPDGLTAEVDPELLKRAVLNLLSNAFRHVPDGGTVRCELRRVEDEIVVVVADSGPGVPEEERAAVFERFRKTGEGADRPEGGTGLGLAIVHEVAELHGGSAEAGEAVEGGARFVLRLPAGDVWITDPESRDRDAIGSADVGDLPATRGFEPATRDPAIPAPETSPGSEDGEPGPAGSDDGVDRPTVLVVEDDADMRAYLCRILDGEYGTVAAADGREGLERALETGPDLVVTDVMMPGVDGVELVEAMRERPGLEDVPVLVLTARAGSDLPERMLRGGAQDYVVKPVRPGELRARIQNLLDLTRSRRLLQEELSSGEESLEELARTAARRKRQLERAVEEKKVLLRELHHRVKGNLQTVTSLLQLQLRQVEDERIRRPLEESRGRVAAMGLLHERLHRAGFSERVELGDYLRSLVADVLRSRGATRGVTTRLALQEMEVSVDTALSCGLIVHELVINALEHAFPEDRGGSVRVALREDGGGRAVLVVADDGRGLEGDAAGPEGALGLELVRSMVGQLDGGIQIRGGDGTRVEIVFPLGEEASPDRPAPETHDGS